MSAIRTRRCLIEYRWLYMIPWYRQVLSLVYGLGVMLIALWALEQGSGRLVILGTVGMSMLTLMLISILSKYLDDNKVKTPYTDLAPTAENDFREQTPARRTDHYVMSVEIDTRGLEPTGLA